MIYQDGVYDITNEQYHAANGISRTQLMLFNKSPYHFWYEVLSGCAEKKESTPAMVVGSAFHTLLLEPEKFGREFIVMPKIDRRTKQGKEDYEIFLSAANGLSVLTEEQHAHILDMVEKIKQHDIVTTLLDDAVFEQSIFWTDADTGIQFKTRPDIWSSKVLVDLKTTQDANLNGFMRSALNYGYYLQAGMAYEACRAINKPFEMFVILACEKEAPYVPAVFMMTQEALQFGVEQFNVYKKKLKKCMDSNEWLGYNVQELSVPKYATITEEE